MKIENQPEIERRKLVAMLERLNLPVTMFDALRNDSYEKHVAKQSVEKLEQVYLALLAPGETLEALQKKFPAWGAGSKHKDKLPSVVTLMAIKQRIMTEYLLNDLSGFDQMLDTVRKRSAGLPLEQQAAAYNTMLSVLAEEMFRAKVNGKSVTENLAVADRLLRAAAIRFRERQGDRRLALREAATKQQASKLKLEWKKFERKAGSRGAAAAKDTANDVVDDDKTDELIEKVFGKNPYENEQENN